MRRHWIDALPALTGLATALVDAALTWAGAWHPSGPTAVLYLSLGIALGRAVSVWLHQLEHTDTR